MKLINNELLKQSQNATKEISKNFKFLENHIIQVQENQVEFEKYLKDILRILKERKDEK